MEQTEKKRKRDSISRIVEAAFPAKAQMTSEERMTERQQLAKVAEDMRLTEEEAEKLYTLQTQKRGRPRGSNGRKEREHRATIIVEAGTMRKLKYIALAETKLYKTVIAEAFAAYIEAFESFNGKIEI